MAAAAPLLVDPLDAILAAAQRAPLVELTEEERALLDELDGRPVQWIAHEQFASKLGAGDDRR